MAQRAVVIGITDYPTSTLQAAAGEAKRWADLLTNPKTYSFPSADVHVLKNAQATKSAVVRELAWLFGGAALGDQLVFAFMGHGTVVDVPRRGGGTTREQGLLLFPLPGADSQAALEQAALTGSDFGSAMLSAGIGSGVLVTGILDCCFSKGFNVPPAGSTVQYLALLSDEELARDKHIQRFGFLEDLRLDADVSDPILVVACQKDEYAIQPPPTAGVYRLLFSQYAQDDLWTAPKESYSTLISDVRKSTTAFGQKPDLGGDTSRAGSAFLH